MTEISAQKENSKRKHIDLEFQLQQEQDLLKVCVIYDPCGLFLELIIFKFNKCSENDIHYCLHEYILYAAHKRLPKEFNL